MPERNNSLSDAVADALERHQHNQKDLKKAKKKHSVMQQIAAQAEQMRHAQKSSDDQDGN